MKDDYYYIGICEKLAQKAEEKGNPPVGALIVQSDKIISKAEEAGRSKKDITCHAEIEAIKKVVKKLSATDLSDCVLYSTHEPCVMCSYAIRFYRIKKVVFLNSVKYLGGITSDMPLLTTEQVPPHWAKAPQVVQLKKREK